MIRKPPTSTLFPYTTLSRSVPDALDVQLGEGLEEARPAGAGIEFGIGPEQRQPAEPVQCQIRFRHRLAELLQALRDPKSTRLNSSLPLNPLAGLFFNKKQTT